MKLFFYQWTPLHIAAEEGNQDPVMCLVEEGPDININILNNDGVSIHMYKIGVKSRLLWLL